jgi:hypothetical protein
MTDRDFTQPSEHEERVSEELEERTGEPAHTGPAGSSDRITGDPGVPSYGAEVEAERTGVSGEEIAEEAAEDESAPLDSAYRPRSG